MNDNERKKQEINERHHFVHITILCCPNSPQHAQNYITPQISILRINIPWKFQYRYDEKLAPHIPSQIIRSPCVELLLPIERESSNAYSLLIIRILA